MNMFDSTKNKKHEKEPTLTPSPPPAPANNSTRLAQLPGIGRFSDGQNVPALGPGLGAGGAVGAAAGNMSFVHLRTKKSRLPEQTIL
jgi:hypothetical protein